MSATDVAFAMVATMQGVLAVGWLFGSWLVVEARRAALHWAVHAAASALSFALLITALHLATPASAELARAAGNLALVLGVIAMQRGIWLFVGRPVSLQWHGLALLTTLVASWVGLAPAGASVRIGAITTVLAVMSVAMAYDLHVYARDRLHFRWPAVMALPGLLAAFGFAWRGVRAVAWPDTVVSEMIIDSVLNIASTMGYMVVVLSFHATLIVVVVGRLVADLRHRSRHDELTGLLNRRAIEEGIEAQIRRSQRTGEVFSVLMLDLDHFKAINDRHGHAAGDAALRHAGALLKAGVREVDAIARIGGEEFLALMPGASLEAALPVAERLRQRLAGQPLHHAGEQLAVRVSIGIAQWNDRSEELSRLLVRADAALYQAKQQGRDQVVVAAVAFLPGARQPA